MHIFKKTMAIYLMTGSKQLTIMFMTNFFILFIVYMAFMPCL